VHGLSLRPVKNRGGGIFIYIVHFDICTAFCPKCFFDGSWWKWGEKKLQEGGMSPILTLDLGDRSH